MPATNTLANAMLNRFFRAQNWSGKPNTLYFGLLTSPPTGNNGLGFTEVPINGSTGYARSAVSVASGNSNWAVGTGASPDDVATNRFFNDVEIVWPKSKSAWGVVTHIAIFSGATGNNMLAWYELPGGLPVTIGEYMVFRIERYKLQLHFDAAAIGDTLALAWLNYWLKAITPTIASPAYLALATAASPSGITEVTGSGYARKSFSLTTGQPFKAAADGETFNTANLDFATSGGAWVGGAAITHWAIMSASSGGVVYLFGQLSESFIVSTTGMAMTIVGGDGFGLKIAIVDD